MRRRQRAARRRRTIPIARSSSWSPSPPAAPPISSRDCWPSGSRTSLGQHVIVENKPGANGAIAAEYVAKSEPDGYTLFFTTVGAVAINPALRGNLPYDPVKDFAPVGMAVFNSTMLVVNASMPVNSARELAALAKERPAPHHRHHRARRHLASRT